MKKRHDLPNFHKIDMSVDVSKLLDVYNNNINEIMQKNQMIDFKSGDSNHSSAEMKACLSPFIADNGYTQIPVTKIREDNLTTYPNLRTGKETQGDERNYSVIEDWAKDSYLEEVINSFSEPTRVRFCVVSPGGFIKPHIDYNTDYSVRYQIPITTNEWSYVGVQRKNQSPEIRHLEADGSVWFMNTGYNHSAWNMGKTDRIHLLVCVNSQKELNDA